ncbi:hypothetical protein HQ590_04605 [bacterium]|nr:hypothetical protein [bacterium]
MNRFRPIIRWFTPMLATALLAVACGRQEEPAAAPPPVAPPPAAEMEMPAPPPAPAAPAPAQPAAIAKEALGGLAGAFAGADAGTRATVEQVALAMKNGEYGKALPLLQQLLANAKLTPEQQKAVNDTVTEARQELASQTVAEPAKAVTDLKKSLPLGQ